MSDKWQQISVKLDAELAQALRDMKQGHTESVSDVVIRLLRKAVRQSSPAPRVAPPGRGSPKSGAGRGAFGAGKRGTPMAPAASAEYGAAAEGKPFAPRAAAGAWGAPRGKRKPAGAGKPRRFIPAPSSASGPRRAGKASRPQQLEGAGEARTRGFRPRADGPSADGPRAGGPRAGGPRGRRASAELGTAEDRPKRPRKTKGRRPGRS